jgi:tRNA(fMet)-specific endonuclease VapC
LDTSFIVTAERSGQSVPQMLEVVGDAWGDADLGISVITVAELTHGVERAKSPEQRQRREAVDVHPVTLEIARRTGTLSGQEAARGVKLPFEDLLIGATALELGFEVVTENARDFEKIPNLTVKRSEGDPSRKP